MELSLCKLLSLSGIFSSDKSSKNPSIVLQAGSDLFSSVLPAMAVEHFQIYSVQITGKCICETFHFSSPLHLIIILHVKHPPINFPQKVRPAMQSFSKKTLTPSPYFWKIGRGQTLYFIFIYLSISKNFIPNFCDTNYDLSSKTTYPLCF